jgi:hypothetical protein
MKKLAALLVGLLATVGAVVTILFFRRKKQGSWSATSSSAKDATTSWGKTAADEAGKAADRLSTMTDGVREATSDMAEEVKPSGS